MKYLKEIWEQQYNPTLKDIEKSLINQEAQKKELKEVLTKQFKKNKMKFIYDDINQVYRISKIKFNKNVIYLFVTIFWFAIFIFTLFNPLIWFNNFYWTFVLLIPIVFLKLSISLDKNKKNKILANFNNGSKN